MLWKGEGWPAAMHLTNHHSLSHRKQMISQQCTSQITIPCHTESKCSPAMHLTNHHSLSHRKQMFSSNAPHKSPFPVTPKANVLQQCTSQITIPCHTESEWHSLTPGSTHKPSSQDFLFLLSLLTLSSFLSFSLLHCTCTYFWYALYSASQKKRNRELSMFYHN